MYDDEKTVPCDTCGEPTTKLSTKRCDWCWEVEGRLDGYLTRGGARARQIVLQALVAAEGRFKIVEDHG